MGLQYARGKARQLRSTALWSPMAPTFTAPAYPLEEVIDPTGAGDGFAGGLLGYLSTVEPGCRWTLLQLTT